MTKLSHEGAYSLYRLVHPPRSLLATRVACADPPASDLASLTSFALGWDNFQRRVRPAECNPFPASTSLRLAKARMPLLIPTRD